MPENQILNADNLQNIGIFAGGIATMVIIPIIKTFFEEWRKNAPIRELRRKERKEIRIAKKKKRQAK